MDPLSLSVSIVGLISLADLIVAKGTRFYTSVRDAPRDISRLVGEVAALSGILSALSRTVDNQTATPHENAIKENSLAESTAQQLIPSDSQSRDRSVSVASLDTLGMVEPVLLQTCRQTLEQLQGTIAKLENRPGETLMNAAKQMRWILKEAEINELLAKLERHKNSFHLAIAADNVLQDRLRDIVFVE